MKRQLTLAVAVVGALVLSAPVAADHKAGHQLPPGQDRVCLVTTGNPGSFRDIDVVDTKWLPRKAAEAQASKDPDTMQVFDYTDDPLVGTQYETAEELCNEHFD